MIYHAHLPGRSSQTNNIVIGNVSIYSIETQKFIVKNSRKHIPVYCLVVETVIYHYSCRGHLHFRRAAEHNKQHNKYGKLVPIFFCYCYQSNFMRLRLAEKQKNKISKWNCKTVFETWFKDIMFCYSSASQ
jgi:hypothetical protein